MKTTLGDGRYEVLRPLGTGATSEVFEVLDTRLGARRALKRMVEAPTPEARRRQEREAAIMARLDHPHVVTVIDAFEDDGQRCVVMELCEGGSLATRVSLEGALSPERVVELGRQVAGALAAAHDSGVLHRDLKPQNILFGPTGDARIADFGLSWVSQDEETLTRTGALMGTVPFMAPELRRGEAHSEASDRYALAATLAWSATGTFPPDLDRPGALDALPAPVAAFLTELMAGDLRVTPDAVVRHRRLQKWTRGGLALAGLVVAAGAGWSLRTPPPLEALPPPRPPSALSAYDALPPCDAGVSFAEWDKYPHYNPDPRLPEEAGGLALVDIDGDEDLDLVVTYVLGVAVDVFRNEGGSLFRRDADNKFEQPTRLDADVSARSLVVGDLQGDGRPEALWLKRNRMGVQVLESDPSGALRTDLYALGDPSATPVLVDTNGDGCDDLLFASMTVPPRIQVRRSKCDGELEVATPFLEGWSGLAREGSHIVVQHADGRVGRLNPTTAEVAAIETPDGMGLEVRRGTGLAVAGLPMDVQLAVGLTETGAVCRAPSDTVHRGLAAVGDIDQDGVDDRVILTTCGYCTSQVILQRGQRD